MTPITFTIHGKPFAKQRPRFSRGRTYTPKETVSFERAVGQIAKPLFARPFSGPIKMTILASFAPPKSWSQKKKREHLGKYHTQRPDKDNLEKAICDGLNRIAFEDDAQVAWSDTRKVWGPEARTVVMIEALDPQEAMGAHELEAG